MLNKITLICLTILLSSCKSQHKAMTINAQHIKLRSIELEHTNPSMGPYENIITISLTNNSNTLERINQFLSESTINNVISVGEFVDAHRTKNEATIKKVESAIFKRKDLNEGESISNLTIYFSDDVSPLIIKDVYRMYSISKFYGDFTKYMVENGSRNEMRNSFDLPIKEETPFPILEKDTINLIKKDEALKNQTYFNYSDKDIVIDFQLTPGGPGSSSYQLKVLGSGVFSYTESSSSRIEPIHEFPKEGKISIETINLILTKAEEINYAELIRGNKSMPHADDGQEFIIRLWGYIRTSSNDQSTNIDEISKFNDFIFKTLKKEIIK